MDNNNHKLVVSFGAGVNSTAMLVGLLRRGERPDVILFADTGAERPETYEHVSIVNEWCREVGFPTINAVQAKLTLEEDCIARKALPGLAYGFKSCSDRFKIQPQKRWIRENGCDNYQFLVGIDAGEQHRANRADVRYPLIEWVWTRSRCVAEIAGAGLPMPGKSACFFCPATKKHEILELQKQHPCLLDRALFIEANADLTSIRGLGRSWSWADFIDAANRQIDLFLPEIDIPCECID